jgi:hypothetical protein
MKNGLILMQNVMVIVLTVVLFHMTTTRNQYIEIANCLTAVSADSIDRNTTLTKLQLETCWTQNR